jgi:hypothetical protein
MALVGQIAIGMKVQTSDLQKGLKNATRQIKGFAEQAKGLLNTVFVGLVGAGGLEGFKKLTEIAGKMEQQVNRTKVIFGSFASEVIEQSNKMADAFGVPKEEFLKGADTMGALFKAEGFTQQQSAQLAEGFTKLALDASRLTGIPVEEVMEKIMKGAAGSGKGLKDLGVYMNEDVVKAEGLRLGLVHVGEEMTESQKIQARLSVISKGLADAQGQLGAQADSIMGRWDAFTGRIANLAETIATMLMPLIGPGGEVQVALAGIQNWLDGVAKSMTASSSTVVEGAQIQAQSIGWIQKAVGFLADAWQAVGLAFKAVQSYVTAGLAYLVDGLGMLAKGLDNLAAKFGKDLGIGTYFDEIGKDLHELSNNQWKEFQESLAKPPSSDGINEWFDNARKKLAETREEAGKTKLDLAKIGGPATNVGTPKQDMQKFGTAMQLRSQEGASTILRSVFGGGLTGKESQKQIADNTKSTADNTAKIAAALSTRSEGAEVWRDFG